MERKKFIKTCCYSILSFPFMASVFQSCGGIYYATASHGTNMLTVAKSEFLEIKKDKKTNRDFVLIKMENGEFPICLHKIKEDNYSASLLRCTHRGCELNVGGGIYSCPCHGSEFSISGKVLQGPADRDLLTFRTDSDNENIYIYFS